MITLIRSALFLPLFWLVVVVFSLAILVVAPLRAETALGWLGRAWGRTSLWLLQRVCGLGFEVQGVEHLPQGPAVVLSNHQSTWETIAIRTLLPLQQAWVLKQELLRIPFYGWALARLRPIAIDRDAGRRAIRRLLSDGKAHLANGRWVVVFPEGTRVPVDGHHRFSAGGAMLAEQAGVPVVPMAHNAGVFWPRHSLRKYPGRILLRVGPPINVAGKSVQQISAEAEAWIRQAMAALPATR